MWIEKDKLNDHQPTALHFLAKRSVKHDAVAEEGIVPDASESESDEAENIQEFGWGFHG